MQHRPCETVQGAAIAPPSKTNFEIESNGTLFQRSQTVSINRTNSLLLSFPSSFLLYSLHLHLSSLYDWKIRSTRLKVGRESQKREQTDFVDNEALNHPFVSLFLIPFPFKREREIDRGTPKGLKRIALRDPDAL
jgi:hypothetical protein